MREYFQVSIPVPPVFGEIPIHNFKALIVETICDQNKEFKCLAEALLASIEVVGISLDDLHPNYWSLENKYLNVSLQLRGSETTMRAWAELTAMIF